MSYGEDGYALKEGDREQLFRELVEANIPYSIEPGVSLQSCEEVLELAAQYPGRIFPAVGIHPTRSIFETWSDRHKLDAYANTPGVIHCFYGAKIPKASGIRPNCFGKPYREAGWRSCPACGMGI